MQREVVKYIHLDYVLNRVKRKYHLPIHFSTHFHLFVLNKFLKENRIDNFDLLKN